MPLKTEIYYNAKLIYTVIHPRSVTDVNEAKQDVRDKIVTKTIKETS